MLGKKELAALRQQKEMLILESTLNRVKLRDEWRALSQAIAPLARLGRLGPKRSALMLVLAPIAGLLLARGLRRSDSWFDKVASAAKWLWPLYRAWKTLTADHSAPAP